MRLRSKLIIALIITGTLSSIIGCHSNNSNTSNNTQPGTSSQLSAAAIKKCDDQRKNLRMTAMAFLGIDALRISSDKILKEILPDDLKELVAKGIDCREASTTKTQQNDDLSDMADIIGKAAQAAGVDDSAPIIIAGTNPVRELDMGLPYYVDIHGNFSVGQAVLQKMDGIQVGDIVGVDLAIGLDDDPTKSFQEYKIALRQVTDATTGANILVPLTDYTEKKLPSFCQGITALDRDAQAELNKVPVFATN